MHSWSQYVLLGVRAQIPSLGYGGPEDVSWSRLRSLWRTWGTCLHSLPGDDKKRQRRKHLFIQIKVVVHEQVQDQISSGKHENSV